MSLVEQCALGTVRSRNRRVHSTPVAVIRLRPYAKRGFMKEAGTLRI